MSFNNIIGYTWIIVGLFILFIIDEGTTVNVIVWLLCINLSARYFHQEKLIEEIKKISSLTKSKILKKKEVKK